MNKSWQSRNNKPASGTFTPSRGKVLQRKCACGGQASQSEGECEDCKKKKSLQRQAAGPAATASAPPIVHEVLSSPGQPLDSATRDFFEPRFGHDFSRVRVHADDRAADSARAVNAAAYTVGRDIVFDSNRYRPSEASGNQLIAHELAHVAQQKAAADSAHLDNGSLRVGQPDDRAEHEAEKAAKDLGSVSAANHERPVVRRAPPDDKKPVAPITTQPTQTQQTPYGQALNQINTLDPLMYGYLSKAALGGASVPVRVISGVDSSVTPPVNIQITFNLMVKQVALGNNLAADFDGGVPVIGGQGTNKTVTADMVMAVDSNSTTPLAQNLFHEGVHMLLFMDDLVPGGSPHGAALNNYKKIAAAHPDSSRLTTQLTTLIENGLKQQKADPSKAGKMATELLSNLWEEKYVRDQEAAKFNAAFTNSALAGTQILHDLNDKNIKPATTDVLFQSVGQAAVKIMDAIDQQVKAAQPTTPPVQNPPAQKPPAKKP